MHTEQRFIYQEVTK